MSSRDYVQPMNSCIQDKDLQELADSDLAEFDKSIAGIRDNLYAPLNIEAMRLQDKLMQLHKLVVFFVRSEEDLNKVAELWEFMAGMCDHFAKRLHKLHAEHPACGANFYYDNILDLRNKCQRLQEMHQ
ncbi:MAG TPA: hypothetical protein VGO67_14470 [Verrucomicrobiae bacterium]